MEDSRKVFKFNGDAGEDFNLWLARPEAALEAKDTFSVVENDVLQDGNADVADETRRKVAQARAIIVQGLGKKPLRLCLPNKRDPYKMWQQLNKRYAVSNVATQVQLHAKLARMAYTNQPMAEYIDSFKGIFNRLADTNETISETMQVATLLASFGNKASSPFGLAISALQSSTDPVSWETASARLIEDFEEKHSVSSSTRRILRRDMALHARTFHNANRRNPGRRFSRDQQRFNPNFGNNEHRNYHRGRHHSSFHGQRQSFNSTNARTSGRRSLGDSRGVDNSDNNNNNEYVNFATMLMAVVDEHDENELLFDSCASDHMISSSSLLSSLYCIEPKTVVLGNGSTVMATHRGTLEFNAILSDQNELPEVVHPVSIPDVLFVPDLKANLVSCPKLCRDLNVEVRAKGERFVVLKGLMMEFRGREKGGVFVIAHKKKHTGIAMAARTRDTEIERRWHLRLAHANVDSIKELDRKNAVTGLDLQSPNKLSDQCEGCIQGKHHRTLRRVNNHRSSTAGEVIHTDLCGPMSVKSIGGSSYFMSCIDECSGYTVVSALAKKSDAVLKFQRFINWFERKFDCKVKRVHGDGGGEFVAFDRFLIDMGIERDEIPPYCPEQNGIAERGNRTLIEAARSMMFHANMPLIFWAEAVAHAGDIRNRFLCSRDRSKTSYEMMTGHKPRVDHLRIFGSISWAYIPKDKRRKVEAKSEEGVLVACLENGLYKIWFKKRKKAVVSKHVKILEGNFQNRTGSIRQDHVLYVSYFLLPRRQRGKTLLQIQARRKKNKPKTGATTNILMRSRTFRRNRPVLEKEIVQNLTSQVKLKINKKMKGCNEATDAADWKKAILSELKSLQDHKTWQKEKIPVGVRPLSTRFVFVRKKNTDGSIARHKARLVVRGFQQGNIDHTYSPVIDITTVRLALTVAIQRNYQIHQMDVRTAFLHGDIDSEVFILPPEGSGITLEDGYGLKLLKGLYGLKQAPRLWYKKWKDVMSDLGFSGCIGDECMFSRGEVWVLMYVDDLIVIGAQIDDIKTVKKELSSRLDMKDLGLLKDFLGLTFVQDDHGAWLTQTHYVRTILQRFGMESCKSVTTPAITRREIVNDEGLANAREYQELTGALLFLSTRTRPDISAAVNLLCRQNASHTRSDMVAAKRVLRYLQSTKDFGLRLKKD